MVGMHLPRRAEAIAVMLGIMVSGCVYLPLDLSYPPGRLRSTLGRAGPTGRMLDAPHRYTVAEKLIECLSSQSR